MVYHVNMEIDVTNDQLKMIMCKKSELPVERAKILKEKEIYFGFYSIEMIINTNYSDYFEPLLWLRGGNFVEFDWIYKFGDIADFITQNANKINRMELIS